MHLLGYSPDLCYCSTTYLGFFSQLAPVITHAQVPRLPRYARGYFCALSHQEKEIQEVRRIGGSGFPSAPCSFVVYWSYWIAIHKSYTMDPWALNMQGVLVSCLPFHSVSSHCTPAAGSALGNGSPEQELRLLTKRTMDAWWLLFLLFLSSLLPSP